MDPMTMYGIGMGANALGGLLSPGQQKAPTTYTDLVIPEQAGLLRMLLQQYAMGGGDFGLGASMREGTSSISNMLARMGISPGSGAHASLLQKMMSGAVAQDADARRQYGLALGQASPALMNYQAQGGALKRDWSNWQPGQTGWQMPWSSDIEKGQGNQQKLITQRKRFPTAY
jgi:hypothetical protein